MSEQRTTPLQPPEPSHQPDDPGRSAQRPGHPPLSGHQWAPPQGPPAGPFPPPAGGGPARKNSGFKGKAVVAVTVVAGLVGGAAGAAGTYAAFRDEAAPQASALDQPVTEPENASSAPAGSVQAVADAVLPSVVAITMSTGQGGGNGSGIVISSDGQILTNNHVAEVGAEGGELTVTFADGQIADASVVGLDPLTDLAVIQAEGVSGLTPAKLGSSDALQVGQEVVAIGAPLGLNSTVTSGIVSALERPVNTSENGQPQATVIDAIQTDAAINPGNSGGALVNLAGEVVGVNSAILSPSSGNIGLGFAIPIDQARPIARQLLETGEAEHALLGVEVMDAINENGVGAGARLGAVTSGGGAEAAGLQEGDVVIKVDDRIIVDSNSLIAAVRSYRPGDQVNVTYLRNGEESTVEATLGSDA